MAGSKPLPQHNGPIPLSLRESAAKGGVFVDGLIEKEAETIEDVFDVLEEGVQRRHTAATACNHRSSRGHSIFTINLRQEVDFK